MEIGHNGGPPLEVEEPSDGSKSNLQEIYAVTSELRWKATRNEKHRMDAAKEIVRWLARRGVHHMDDIQTAHIRELIREWQAKGNAPTTVIWKLSCLGTMADVAMAHEPKLATKRPPTVPVKRKRVLKWWLNPEERDKLLPWARANLKDGELVADLIEFIYFTGVRVEEALRLQCHHFSGLQGEHPIFTVPGLKTDNAQTTLPLKLEAALVAQRRIAVAGGMGRLFPISYEVLKRRWQECRAFLGLENAGRTCSLRALRRSFAKVATDKGMPTEVLRVYLRHTHINTTTGYLQVVGGYEVETVRRWL